MTSAQMLESAWKVGERSRARGASEADAMDDALRELSRCRQCNRSPSARGKAVPVSHVALAIIHSVLASHGVTLVDAREGGRTKHHARITAARNESVYLARLVDADVSYPSLAALFERDHTSILAGQRTFAKRMKDNDVLAARKRKLVEGLPSGAVVAEQVAGGVA